MGGWFWGTRIGRAGGSITFEIGCAGQAQKGIGSGGCLARGLGAWAWFRDGGLACGEFIILMRKWIKLGVGGGAGQTGVKRRKMEGWKVQRSTAEAGGGAA